MPGVQPNGRISVELSNYCGPAGVTERQAHAGSVRCGNDVKEVRQKSRRGCQTVTYVTRLTRVPRLARFATW